MNEKEVWECTNDENDDVMFLYYNSPIQFTRDTQCRSLRLKLLWRKLFRGMKKRSENVELMRTMMNKR